MLYLLVQICWYLLIALLIGGVIGWLLKSFVCERECEAKVGEWKAKYGALEGRYAALEAAGNGDGNGGSAGSLNSDGDMDALKAHISGLEETNRLQADRIADLEGRLTAGAEARAGDAELAAENARLQGEVSSLKTRVAAAAVAPAAVTPASASSDGAALEAENLKLKADLDDMAKKLAEGEAASSDGAALEAENLKLKADLEGLNQKLAEREKSSGNEAAKLAADLAECKAGYAGLEEKLKAALAGKASGKKEAFKTDAPPPASLLKEAEGEKDDLKEIRGVGPVMEKTMNKLGIFHFRQIADLSPKDVEWVSANINTFPDRIERDQWVSQAAELHKKHHG